MGSKQKMKRTEVLEGREKNEVVLPCGWEMKKLGSLVEITSGVSPSLINLELSGKYPYLKVEDLNNCQKYQKTSREFSNLDKYLIPSRSVIFPKRGAAILNNKVRINFQIVQMDSNMMAITPNENILNHEYLYYSITHEKLFKIADTSTIPQINNKHITPYKIPLPPLQEQRAIANILSTWDSAINLTQNLISQKEAEKKWLMQNLLTGKKRLKGFESRKWGMKSLDKVVKLIIREIQKPPMPYLGIGLRSHGKGTFLKYDEQPEKNSMDKFYIVRPNDLIVNITFAWEQAIAIVKNEDDGALASHRFPTYEFIKDKGCPDFFRHVIVQPKMKYMMDLISPGGAGRNRVMSKKDFIKLELYLPDYEEQTAIAQVLQTADKEIELLKNKLVQQKLQKKGLMQVLLTGRVRVNMDNFS